jgi:hypothetical protein
MTRLFVRQASRLLASGALLIAASFPAQAATIQVPFSGTVPVQILGTDNLCTGGFTLGGTSSAPTFTCVTGGGGTPPPSGCSLVGTAVGSTGGQTTLTASCSGGSAPTSYAWTANPTPSSGWTSTTSGGVQTPSITATTTFTVTPSNSNGGGNVASATVTVSGGGGGGGGGTINCTTGALGTGVTGTTQIRDINWANPTSVSTAGMGPNDAAVIRFTTGPQSSGQLGTLIGVSGNQGDYLAYLSTTACDFRQPPTLGWGSIGLGWTPTVWFTVGTDDSYDAALRPNTTYYYNVKVGGGGCNQGNCNATYTLNKPPGL